MWRTDFRIFFCSFDGVRPPSARSEGRPEIPIKFPLFLRTLPSFTKQRRVNLPFCLQCDAFSFRVSPRSEICLVIAEYRSLLTMIFLFFSPHENGLLVALLWWECAREVPSGHICDMEEINKYHTIPEYTYWTVYFHSLYWSQNMYIVIIGNWLQLSEISISTVCYFLLSYASSFCVAF